MIEMIIFLINIFQSLKQAHLPVEFITIAFGAVVLSSIPCYYSDKLLEKVRFVNTIFL